MKHIDQKGFSALDIILALSLVAVIGIAGIFAYKNSHSKPSASISTSSSPTPKPTASVVADKYKGWKTYTSSRDGYSIKYPANWIVIPESASDGPYIRNFDPNTKPKSGSGYPEGYINLRVLVAKDSSNYGGSGMSTAEWYSALGTKTVSAGPVSYSAKDVKGLKVNNLDAKSAKAVFDEIDEDLFILHNGSLYEINLYPYGSSSEATVKQMLDSFEIL
jgi:hypothetical protein